MARIDQILDTATDLTGEPIMRGAVIVPPGSAAFRNIGGGSGYSAAALAMGAIRSKRDGSAGPGDAGGASAEFPKTLGLLAVAQSTVYFCKTSRLGGQPTEVVLRWPADALTITFVPKTGKMRNPAVDIEFPDGSSLLAFGEKKWGIEQFA